MLESSGLASLGADTLALRASRLLGPIAVFAQGDAIPGGFGIPFHDGLSCLGGVVLRLAVVSIAGGEASLTHAGGSAISGLGMLSAPGQVRTYQVVHRDAAAFCTPATMNSTNGLTITWTL